MGRLTRAIADPNNPGSLSFRARTRRWAELAAEFPELPQMRVVDLGGEVSSWAHAPTRPGELLIVNLLPQVADDERVRTVVADACDLPASIRGERFDLVYSNSVIEHVGGHARRVALTTAVHELAPHHWIQTPYRYFPLEPHWLFPAFQLLPLPAKAEVTRRWPLGHRHAKRLDQAVHNSLGVELLTKTEMRHYFPDSAIREERLAGLTKSLIAVR
jgi:Methyltransferase domain